VSRERIRIELTRTDDTWHADVTEHDVESAPDVYVRSLVEHGFDGSGPADVLEQLGQELDELEVERIRREREL
jgi:hypothetical protein